MAARRAFPARLGEGFMPQGIPEAPGRCHRALRRVRSGILRRVHCQVLSSGSGGNCTLLRAGELRVLVDAGLSMRALRERLEAARLPHRGVDCILVTHGHLDHARSAGALARRHGAEVHCPERIMRSRSVLRAPRMHAIRIGSEQRIETARGSLGYRPVLLPHDCDPTVAYRVEQNGKVVVILTDMGVASESVARELSGAHVLVLEFNHDLAMLESGPYAPSLKRRVAGGRGHLSNAQAARMLELMAGPRLHTVVLAHLSRTNNRPELALEAAHACLERLGRSDVRVLVASQDEVGPNLEV